MARVLEAVEKRYNWKWPSVSFRVLPVRWCGNMAYAESRESFRLPTVHTQLFHGNISFLYAGNKERQPLWSINVSFNAVFWRQKQILMNCDLISYILVFYTVLLLAPKIRRNVLLSTSM
jgi:hypothetical protein